MTHHDATIIRAENVVKTFRRGRSEIRAVDNVSVTMRRGRNLGIVGESGSGKSTLARMLMGLETATSGTIVVDGEDMTVAATSRAARQARAKRSQMVYQDPYGSLDPRQTVTSALREVLVIHSDLDRAGRERRIHELCDLVGLSRQQRERDPRDLSGGQRQRVAIARALAVEPALIVLDEAVAALDISIQAQILNLLMDVQDETGTDYVLISHDLSVVAHLTHDVIVMRSGRVVERGETSEVLNNPEHEYTRLLRDSVPTMDWRRGDVLDRIVDRLTA